jgi:PAS domain S-box-containing protein
LREEQQKLKESEEKFSQSFQYSSIGMAIVAPDGSLRDANESFYKMLGYTREELLRKTFQDITHPDDLEKDLDCLYKACYAKKSKLTSSRKRYIHKNGNYVWALLSVSLGMELE